MRNNRAGLLALLVLAIATLLMVFFVLPRISGEDKPAEPSVTSPKESRPIAPESGEAGKSPDLIIVDEANLEGVTEKVSRLAATATQAINDLVRPFDDGRFPSAGDFSTARQKVYDELSTLQTVDIPEALDETTSKLLTTARSSAARAIEYLRDIPQQPEQAVGEVRRLAGVFAGTDDGKPLPEPVVEPVVEPVPEPAVETPVGEAPAATASDTPITPAFDVLRVEPNGSAVIAGKTTGNSKVEIVSGGKVIAETKAESNGDFVAILETPLAPGAHELTLRATGDNGKTSYSEETATVSIPEKSGGDLLAMVTTPGKASRLLTVPEGANGLTTEAPAATSDAAEAKPDATAQTTDAPSTDATTAPTEEAPAQAIAPTAGTAAIQVTAVEFEGQKIFIAGTTAAGSKVRALFNEAVIGEATAEGSGNFVIEGTVDLPVGSHTITAEMLDKDGNVLVRVRVPFDRPDAHQATVAQQPAVAASQAPQENEATKLDRTKFAGLRSDIEKAFGILTGLYADDKRPTLEEVQAAHSSNSLALGSLAEFKASADTLGTFSAFTADIAEKAKALVGVFKELPAEVSAVRYALPGLEPRIAALLVEEPSADAAGSTGPATFDQAPLAASNDAVIIRRGDTLWQISRRVYGQGVRYTTIYLANQDQITNPDFIEPGQIFGVPDKALDNAEEIHRNRLNAN
jgi:nucleoid-associated protein YgaU